MWEETQKSPVGALVALWVNTMSWETETPESLDLHTDDASPLLTRPSPEPERPSSLFVSPSLLEDDHKWLELHGDESFCLSTAAKHNNKLLMLNSQWEQVT